MNTPTLRSFLSVKKRRHEQVEKAEIKPQAGSVNGSNVKRIKRAASPKLNTERTTRTHRYATRATTRQASAKTAKKGSAEKVAKQAFIAKVEAQVKRAKNKKVQKAKEVVTSEQLDKQTAETEYTSDTVNISESDVAEAVKSSLDIVGKSCDTVPVASPKKTSEATTLAEDAPKAVSIPEKSNDSTLPSSNEQTTTSTHSENLPAAPAAEKTSEPHVTDQTETKMVEEKKPAETLTKETAASVDAIPEVKPPALLPSKPRSFAAPTQTRLTIPSYSKYTRLQLSSDNFQFPDAYIALEKILAALDHTVLFMRGQRQRCVYHKVRRSVEEMSRRTFELSHLAQIKTVYPEAYTFEAARVVEQGERVASIAIDIPVSADVDTTTSVITTSRDLLTQRRDTFHDRLLARLKEEHKAYLVAHHQLDDWLQGDTTRWHASFDLDRVKPIEQAPLPLPTLAPVAQARKLALFNTREANNDSSSKNSNSASVKGSVTPPKTDTTPAVANTPSLSERASSLLARIRQKQQKRNGLTLAQEQAQSRETALLSRLPALIDAITFMATSLGKRVLSVKDIVRRQAAADNGGLSEVETLKLLRRCSELVPDWCQLTANMTGTFVRIDRQADVAQVKARIQAALGKQKPGA